MFGNRLKHRVARNNRNASSTIGVPGMEVELGAVDGEKKKPLLYTSINRPTMLVSTSKRMLKVTKNLTIHLLSKITTKGIFLAITFCISYLCLINWYNRRSVRDPCMVAYMSKNNIRKSLLTLKRDVLIQRDADDPKYRNDASIIAAAAIVQKIIEAKGGEAANANEGKPFELKIPKVIHQQWKTNTIPNKFATWRNKWLQLYPEPEYKHMLWTDTNARELIENYYPWFLPTYDSYEHNINRADAVRYFILYHYGGIYADLDYEPIVNFYDYLPPNQVSMVESPYYWNEKTQNCLMSSPQHDPFWIDLFVVLVKNAKREEVLEATGPKMVDEAMEYSVHPAHILPCENFQRVPLGEYDQSLWTSVYDREVMFRLKPIARNCGFYSDDKCHFGKHHNTVSYRTTSGKVL